MQITIREIRKEDNASVEQIIRTCLDEFGAPHVGTAWADPFLGRFSEVYAAEGNCYWVAVDKSGTVLGGTGIGGFLEDPKVCELQKMYCLPVIRGTGTAQKLLDKALAYAKEYYDVCFLETLDNMKAAQRFYEKNGFVKVPKAPVDTGHYACGICYELRLR